MLVFLALNGIEMKYTQKDSMRNFQAQRLIKIYSWASDNDMDSTTWRSI